MKLAFVFPGQGSQSLGMLSELAAASPIIAETFGQASDALGYDLWDTVQNGPVEKINQTEITQPAMLAAGVATWRVWQDKSGPSPEILAGHSLGEYTALVCANSFDLADAIKLVADRGRFMQDAVPAGEGAMAAILGLDDEVVKAACVKSAQGEVVSAVNFNSPGQVVIAGQATAVQRTVDTCKEEGAKRAVLLPVSVPSHCQLMDPAAHQLAERLQQLNINPPSLAVINNVDVTNESETQNIRDVLTRQLCNPVRWVETIQRMASEDVTNIIECGPGKVLAGLNKRIDRNVKTTPVFSPSTMDDAIAELIA